MQNLKLIENGNEFTCNMKKPDQPNIQDISVIMPVTQCCCSDEALVELWWPPPCVNRILIIGPLYKVITIAPLTVIAVPITFARLCIFLRLTVSNLVHRIRVYMSCAENHEKKKCKINYMHVTSFFFPLVPLTPFVSSTAKHRMGLYFLKLHRLCSYMVCL